VRALGGGGKRGGEREGASSRWRGGWCLDWWRRGEVKWGREGSGGGGECEGPCVCGGGGAQAAGGGWCLDWWCRGLREGGKVGGRGLVGRRGGGSGRGAAADGGWCLDWWCRGLREEQKGTLRVGGGGCKAGGGAYWLRGTRQG